MQDQLLSSAESNIQVSKCIYTYIVSSILTCISTTNRTSGTGLISYLGTTSSYTVHAVVQLSSLRCLGSYTQNQKALLLVGLLSCKARRAKRTKQAIGSI
jgi:hypothetical protein